ncbi:peptide/nickel transport system permease protein [Devosia enhydra]|uniref:Peptide/nickel transport system permease protein n=1 Tax=Devosia enhydra TaxID=665118 RepID=A0A1K2I1V6_9HYPH|nr:ABC transporter permease [Devosia enhydra]SFZ86366.1 peptide/nickel transport system permease protein [Devosia enhydra]
MASPSPNAVAAAPSAAPAKPSPRPSIWRTVLRDKIGMFGAVLVTLMLGAALLAQWIAPRNPTQINGRDRLQGPSATYLLGTDELGRDLLSRALYGAQVSLTVSITVVTFAALIGISIGVASGYFRGILDGVSMRVMDVLFAFPTILLALAVVSTLGTDTRNLIIALTIVYVPTFARISRGAAMSVSREVYVEAAKSVGVGHLRILLRYVLPNITAPIAVQITISLAYAILVESSLSYLGLGVQPPAASWGSMLASGKVHMERSLWPSLVPGMFIVITVLGFNLLGDALRDSLDPRLRAAMR